MSMHDPAGMSSLNRAPVNMLPLTYPTDILHGDFNKNHTMLLALHFCLLGPFCIFLFSWSLRNVRRRWIF